MLWILDSWNAVAIAIVVARGDSPRSWAIAAISDGPATLLEVDLRAYVADRRDAVLAAQRLAIAQAGGDENPRHHQPDHDEPSQPHGRRLVGVQGGVELDARTFAARSASMAPVWLLVRNRMPSWPDSSAALTVEPSGIVTLEPAVT